MVNAPQIRQDRADNRSGGRLPRPPAVEGPAPAEVIYYLCPDIRMPSAGIRRLYRHVHLLRQAGFDAHILHLHAGFVRDGMPAVSVRYLDSHALETNAITVVPEGFPAMMDALKSSPGRRFAIALNWDYVFKHMPEGTNWRSFNIERVLVVSPGIGRMIAWSMGLPIHVLGSSIDHCHYFVDATPKHGQVAYIQRKAADADLLKRVLKARNPDLIHKIKWIGLDGLGEAQYAASIRQTAIFLNLSPAEGFPTSCVEAMAAGAMVVGYDTIGGRDLLIRHGPGQNCILTDNGDYVALAYALEPLLNDLIQGREQHWASILANAARTAAAINIENERRSLISFWRGICLNHHIN